MPVAESEVEYSLGIPEGMPLDFAAMDEQPQEPETPVVPPPTKPSKPIVGIIYPPPEVRNIVDKTASFVARNGPEFEARIKLNEQNNAKFNFLSKGDPYHAYYEFRVKEFQEGKGNTQQSTTANDAAMSALSVKTAAVLIDEAKKKKQSELLKQVELPFVPKDPPAEFEFIADPPSISAIDLDIVKLTAQFVARNGRQFLSSLMTREQRNYQFDFLRPQHSLFQYFTKLLEQYTKVLIPPKDLIKKLGSEERKKILEDVKYRANWIKHQEAQRRKEEEEAEKERMAYASIDWHDFVVVETVDFQPFEAGNFPPPTTPQEVGARVLLQDRILSGQIDKEATTDDGFAAQDDTEVQDMEEDSSSSSEDESEERPEIKKPDRAHPSLEPISQDQVIIKKDYDPKHARAVVKEVTRPVGPEEYTISPITGERIPVSKLQEHMRIGLLDPRWKDQRDRQLMEKQNQESVYAPGVAIDESLKQLAERRSDIFGTGVEETPIGKKQGEEERIPGMPWDPTAGLSISSNNQPPLPPDDQNEEQKKESIGPAMESSVISAGPQLAQPPPPASVSGPQAPTMPTGPPGILQAPGASPMAGIVRPVHQMGPPQGMMFMQGIPGQMRPLLGIPQPGFSPFGVAPPGGINRPPLLPPGGMPPNLMAAQAMPPMNVVPPPVEPVQEEEPPAKKAKTVEDLLIPEGQFLASNSSPATFNVACPSVLDKPEMNLSGQMIPFTLSLTDPVSVLKTKINEVIGLAPGKQKLSRDGLFFKDQNTLAYYNIGDGSTVLLSLKERGGRKK